MLGSTALSRTADRILRNANFKAVMTDCTLKPGRYEVIDSYMREHADEIILCLHEAPECAVPLKVVASDSPTYIRVTRGILTVTVSGEKKHFSYSER